MAYYLQAGLDARLIDFINGSKEKLDYRSVGKDYSEDVADKFFNDVAVCNVMSNDHYRDILQDINCWFDNYDATEISDEKIEILIQNEILPMEAESLRFIRQNYKKHIFSFIKKNLDTYLEMQTRELFVLEEALDLLKWQSVTDDQKISLLKNTDAAISVVGQKYTDRITANILAEHYESKDAAHIFKDYACYGEETQKQIAVIAHGTVPDIINNGYSLDDALLSLLLQSSDLSRQIRIQLLCVAISKLTEQERKEHFSELGLSELNRIFAKNSGRSNYEKNEETSAILQSLRDCGKIHSFEEDSRNTSKYVVSRNIPRGK